MAHDKLKPFLAQQPGQKFVAVLTQNAYDWASKIPAEYYRYRVFEEYTIRYSTDQLTRLGLDRKKHYRLDAVLFVEPGYRALNQGQTYTVGLEIKGGIADLRQDVKFEAYIGWTDYLFIAVDGRIPGFIDEAEAKAQHDNRIGVMDIASGTIYKMPERCEVSDSHRIDILQSALYHYFFNDNKTIEVEPMADIQEAAGTANRTYRREVAEAFRATQPQLVQDALDAVEPTAQKVYEAIANGTTKTADIATTVGISPSAVGNATAALKNVGLIDRVGGRKFATYKPAQPDPIKLYKGKCLKCDLYKRATTEDCAKCEK